MNGFLCECVCVNRNMIVPTRLVTFHFLFVLLFLSNIKSPDCPFVTHLPTGC